MTSVYYRDAKIVAVKTSYLPGDNTTVQLAFKGEGMKFNSIRIHGVVNCNNGAVPPVARAIGVDTGIDPYAGAHSFIREFSTSINGASLPQTKVYPRQVRAKAEATRSRVSLGTETETAMELRSHNKLVTSGYLTGEEAGTAGAFPFTINPEIAINNTYVESDAGMQGADVPIGDGVVELTWSWAYPTDTFYGQFGAETFSITSLRVTYETTDIANVPAGKVMGEHNEMIRSNVDSGSVALTASLAFPVDSVSFTFIPRAEENSYTYNSHATRVLPPHPTLGKVVATFSVNDVDNGVFTQPLNTQENILKNYLKSFRGEPGMHGLTQEKLQGSTPYMVGYPPGEGYGVGMNFGRLMDLTTSTAQCKLESGATNLLPYVAYQNWHGYIQL